MSRPTLRVSRRMITGVVASATVLLGGCITGHEAENAMGHDKARELQEARRLREAGVINDDEYDLRKARIEAEVEG